jgi:plasmid stability protein
MEEEVRDILRNAVHEAQGPRSGLGSEIAKLFAKDGLEHEIAELRGHVIKPITFR